MTDMFCYDGCDIPCYGSECDGNPGFYTNDNTMTCDSWLCESP